MSPPDPWDRRAERFTARPLRELLLWGLGITAVILVIVAFVGLVSTGSIFFQGEAAKRTVNERTNVKVFTPENKVAQIAFFHDTCNAVNAQLAIVGNNQATYDADLKASKAASDPIRQQQAADALSQDARDVAGARNIVQTTVAAYNSRSAQSTANVFKDSGLPDRITLPGRIEPGFTIDCK